jgi:hypothetical protein
MPSAAIATLFVAFSALVPVAAGVSVTLVSPGARVSFLDNSFDSSSRQKRLAVIGEELIGSALSPLPVDATLVERLDQVIRRIGDDYVVIPVRDASSRKLKVVFVPRHPRRLRYEGMVQSEGGRGWTWGIDEGSLRGLLTSGEFPARSH